MLAKSKSLNVEKIKYVKLVNHIESQRKEWSYAEHHLDDEFDLHWISNSGCIDQRHRTNANKAQIGDLIILCQNHYQYGHRATHIVEVINNEVKEQDNMLTRLVKLIWIPINGYEQAPETKDVIGEEFSFNNGLLISVKSPTIKINNTLLN